MDSASAGGGSVSPDCSRVVGWASSCGQCAVPVMVTGAKTSTDRWRFPRGTDLRLVTPAQAEHAADIINHQRRRSLNHTSPAELYAAVTAH